MRIAWLLIALAACATRRDRVPGDGQDRSCETEGEHRCTGATYEVCTNGQFVTETECTTACLDALGCVDCGPGELFCKDGNVSQCDDTGHAGQVVQVCTGVQTCIGGGCADACMDAANSRSYIGCEYYAVDLSNAIEVIAATSNAGACAGAVPGGVIRNMPVCNKVQGINVLLAGLCDPPATMGGNPVCPATFSCTARDLCVLDAQHSPFGIVVSNPQARDVNVTVTGPGGQTIQKVIAAGQVSAILPQAGNAIPDQSVVGSAKEKRAYRITSDLPIVAYQFNPLDNVNVFSNDASLLVPRPAFDVDYYTMSFPTLDRRSTAQNAHSFYGYLTVVAWQDNTQVSITPTAAVAAGATAPPIAAGSTATFTLNAMEVLQLEAIPAAGGGDLTGTHITSPNGMSFGVFGGHEAAQFGEATPPDSQHTRGPCCADHLEEMIFPSTTWGKEFAIARSQPRTNEPDLLRIMAQKAGTTITFTPPPVVGACGTLSAGQFCEVKIATDTEVSSSEPILIGHFLESSIWQNNAGAAVGSGDPSMAIAVPTEQYRKDYTILIPAEYAQNFISISAAATGGVTVDGQLVNVTTFAGGGTHRVARVPVTAGQHTITCADGCGVLVYGYSDAVSYMFAGGLDLKPIVVL